MHRRIACFPISTPTPGGHQNMARVSGVMIKHFQKPSFHTVGNNLSCLDEGREKPRGARHGPAPHAIQPGQSACSSWEETRDHWVLYVSGRSLQEGSTRLL